MPSCKTRMSALDVRCAVASLRSKLVGLRLTNVYDSTLSRRVYMLKFSKGDEKYHILIESGIRFHPTTWQRDKNTIPSAFVMRLRKFLRSRRLENLSQLGADRVIDFTFGTGGDAHHLIVEFYVAGNIVLTDAQYKILSILRPHSNSEDAGCFAVNATYPVGRNLWAKTFSNVKHLPALLTASPDDSMREAVKNDIGDVLRRHSQEVLDKEAKQNSKKSVAMHENERLSPKALPSPHQMMLKDVVKLMLPFAHPNLVSHSLTVARRRVSSPSAEEEAVGVFQKCEKVLVTSCAVSPWIMDWILEACVECLKKLAEVSGPEDFLGDYAEPNQLSCLPMGGSFAEPAGYILASAIDKVKSETETQKRNTDSEMPHAAVPADEMFDFSPVLLHHFANPDDGMRLLKFPTFLDCLDAYFSQTELERQVRVTKTISEQQMSKGDKIQIDQQRRLNLLRAEGELAATQAALIEANQGLVQQCITMLQAALATGVSWRELAQHVELERQKGHPLACVIDAMDLEHDEVTLLLSDGQDDAVDSTDKKIVPVPICISVSAYGNVEALHERRKQIFQKEKRTELATQAALNKAQAKMTKQQKLGVGKTKGPAPSGLVRIRKHFWFEKFNWFISSENFLVLAGRDATQNDMLYKRYLEKNDIFVHADAHGAPACIIKNPDQLTIPPTTLLEAGRMSVCRSSAWQHKLMTGSWWVYPSQVSKTVPAGEYIVSGSFLIRGKKNMLPPFKLEMGIGVLFRLGDDSVNAHDGERRAAEPLLVSDENNRRDRFDAAGHASYPTREEQSRIERELKEQDDAWNAACEEKMLRQLEKKAKYQQRAKNTDVPQTAEVCCSEDAAATRQPRSVPQAHGSKPQFVRGKKQKLKRVKQKYGDQDVEERELRMALLGSKAMKLNGVMEPDAFATGEANDAAFSERAEPINGEEKSGFGKEHTHAALHHETVENQTLATATSTRHEPCSTRYDSNVSELRYLTGQPRESDTLLAAIPVCAPWNTLQSYKYKAKLLPGSAKKGEVGRQAFSAFLQQAQSSKTEKELLRAVDVNDIHNTLPSNVQVVLGSAHTNARKR